MGEIPLSNLKTWPLNSAEFLRISKEQGVRFDDCLKFLAFPVRTHYYELQFIKKSPERNHFLDKTVRFFVISFNGQNLLHFESLMCALRLRLTARHFTAISFDRQ